MTDHFTATPDAAAAVEAAHSLPAEERVTLVEAVDEDGWFPGAVR